MNPLLSGLLLYPPKMVQKLFPLIRVGCTKQMGIASGKILKFDVRETERVIFNESI